MIEHDRIWQNIWQNMSTFVHFAAFFRVLLSMARPGAGGALHEELPEAKRTELHWRLLGSFAIPRCRCLRQGDQNLVSFLFQPAQRRPHQLHVCWSDPCRQDWRLQYLATRIWRQLLQLQVRSHQCVWWIGPLLCTCSGIVYSQQCFDLGVQWDQVPVIPSRQKGGLLHQRVAAEPDHCRHSRMWQEADWHLWTDFHLSISARKGELQRELDISGALCRWVDSGQVRRQVLVRAWRSAKYTMWGTLAKQTYQLLESCSVCGLGGISNCRLRSGTYLIPVDENRTNPDEIKSKRRWVKIINPHMNDFSTDHCQYFVVPKFFVLSFDLSPKLAWVCHAILRSTLQRSSNFDNNDHNIDNNEHNIDNNEHNFRRWNGKTVDRVGGQLIRRVMRWWGSVFVSRKQARCQIC